jgi:hypothetical protein
VSVGVVLNKSALADTLCCQIGDLAMTYLGMPLEISF